MDRAYLIWIGVLAVGAVLGLFLKPRIVGICVGSVLGVLFVGLLVGAATGSETMTWVSGIALMAAPVLGAILFAGAALSNAAINALRRASAEKEKNEG